MQIRRWVTTWYDIHDGQEVSGIATFHFVKWIAKLDARMLANSWAGRLWSDKYGVKVRRRNPGETKRRDKPADLRVED